MNREQYQLRHFKQFFKPANLWCKQSPALKCEWSVTTDAIAFRYRRRERRDHPPPPNGGAIRSSRRMSFWMIITFMYPFVQGRFSPSPLPLEVTSGVVIHKSPRPRRPGLPSTPRRRFCPVKRSVTKLPSGWIWKRSYWKTILFIIVVFWINVVFFYHVCAVLGIYTFSASSFLENVFCLSGLTYM